ncbi:hypothetical protein Tco_0102913 [Tanacetum coccineum]
MQASRDLQKSYVDRSVKPLEFQPLAVPFDEIPIDYKLHFVMKNQWKTWSVRSRNYRRSRIPINKSSNGTPERS